MAGRIVYLKHLQSGVRMKSGWAEARGQGEVSHYDPRDTADWQLTSSEAREADASNEFAFDFRVYERTDRS